MKAALMYGSLLMLAIFDAAVAIRVVNRFDAISPALAFSLAVGFVLLFIFQISVLVPLIMRLAKRCMVPREIRGRVGRPMKHAAPLSAWSRAEADSGQQISEEI